MTFISYAQNFEDIMLWRALRDVEDGFYIDVGANHPTKESVTKAFYDRGWTGINIEPEAELYNCLKLARLKDINLNIAISARHKKINFYVSKHRGLHTTDKISSEYLVKDNFLLESKIVNALTLDEVYIEHALKEVNFLKIDVEGAEKDVLDSLTFKVFRPWIIVIEATKPLSQEDISAKWDYILFENDYILGYFDGLNKYYISEERRELLKYFKVPPNVFDCFELSEDSYFVQKKQLILSNKGSSDMYFMKKKVKQTVKKGVVGTMNLLVNRNIRFRNLLIRALSQSNEGEISNIETTNLLPKVIYGNEGGVPTLEDPVSQLCTANQLYSRIYQKWMYEMRELPRLHRKEWEWVYIAEVLSQNGMLQEGKKGLGFGCGQEPLPLVFANYGARITITDMDEDGAVEAGWSETDQHIKNIDKLYDSKPEIMNSKKKFLESCDFKVVDMNSIPDDMKGYDFLWSSCSFEHLGSIKHGLDFVKNAMKCLRPGGIAVHTTEFNLSSNDKTVENPSLSIFRLKDIQLLKNDLQKDGYVMSAINTNVGTEKPDKYVDLPPYKSNIHLRLLLDRYISTSIGIIVKKPKS